MAARISARDETYTCGEGIENEAELVANAHLIAAAPDLLAALRAFANLSTEDVDALGMEQEVLDARAAIAKAEGKS